MDTDKSLGIIKRLKLGNRFPEHECLAAYLNAGVIVGGLDVFNFVDGNEYVFWSIRNEEAFRKGGSIRLNRTCMLKETVELRLDDRCMVCGDSLPYVTDGSLKPFRTDSFDEIVQRMTLKCLDGRSVLGRDKDGQRHVHDTDVRKKIAAETALMTKEQLTAVLDGLRGACSESKPHISRLLVKDVEKEIFLSVEKIE